MNRRSFIKTAAAAALAAGRARAVSGPAPRTLLVGISSAQTRFYRIQPSGSIETIHTLLHSRGERGGRGVVCCQFAPKSPLPGQTWNKGDVFFAYFDGPRRHQVIVQLEQAAVGFRVREIYRKTGKPIQGLAFDPSGRLYFSVLGDSTIYRVVDDHGRLTGVSAFSGPKGLPWEGDFAIAADGTAFASSGPGVKPGMLYKSSWKTDFLRDPIAQQNEWRPVYRRPDDSEIHGFSFYDPDVALFSDGGRVFYEVDIDPRLDPLDDPFVVPTPTNEPRPHVVDAPAGDEYGGIAAFQTRWMRYLEDHSDVRKTISWDLPSGKRVFFPSWNDVSETADFERQLHRMYGWALMRGRTPLSYRADRDCHAPGEPLRTAPAVREIEQDFSGCSDFGDGVIESDFAYLERDAQESFLSHLAVRLWMAASEQTSWKLEDLGPDDQERLLAGWRTFAPDSGTMKDSCNVAGSLNRYLLNIEELGEVFPSDAGPGLDFLVGRLDSGPRSSAIRADQQKTIYAVTQWMLEHLRHEPNRVAARPLLRRRFFGTFGPQSLDTMLRPLDVGDAEMDGRHWARGGCHGATGFLVQLLRLALIPAQSRYSVQERFEGCWGFHRGVDIPTAKLACFHTDLLYHAEFRARDVPPRALYNAFRSYGDYVQTYFPKFDDAQQARKRWANFNRDKSLIAAEHLAYELALEFWDGLNEPMFLVPPPCGHPGSHVAVKEALQKGPFWQTARDAELIFCRYVDRFYDLVQKYYDETDPGLDVEDRLDAAKGLYDAEITAWIEAR